MPPIVRFLANGEIDNRDSKPAWFYSSGRWDPVGSILAATNADELESQLKLAKFRTEPAMQFPSQLNPGDLSCEVYSSTGIETPAADYEFVILVSGLRGPRLYEIYANALHDVLILLNMHILPVIQQQQLIVTLQLAQNYLGKLCDS